MIGIIGALNEEVNGLIQKLSGLQTKTIGGTAFHFGSLFDKNVVVALSGVGKVNASMTAAIMLSSFPNIKSVINIGVAGGVAKTAKQGDLLLASACVQHDFRLNSADYPDGRIPGFDFTEFPSDPYLVELSDKILTKNGLPYHRGVMATGDEFINSSKMVEFLRLKFSAIGCDMESAAIAHVCKKMGIKFLSLRAVSDNGDDNADEDFSAFLEKAAAINISFITELIRKIN